jgi:hypothetical protein
MNGNGSKSGKEMGPMNELRRIPEFASLEEEAQFWDTHDTTDYEGEFKPVQVTFAEPLSTGVTVRLDGGTLALLRSRARERGIGPSTLARLWILDRLQGADGPQ